MNSRWLFFIALLIMVPIHADCQSITEDNSVKDALNLIEKWIESQAAYDQIPGISIAIVHDQKLIWKHALGYSNPEKKTLMETTSIYSICSISKLFTSIALMQLRDQGLVRLDNPVSKHLTWFNIEQVHPDSPPITIESILSHSSGLPRESDYPYWNAPKFSFPEREKMMAQLKNQKTLYPAYTYYQYSNLGLTLAGEIVAAVSGKKFETYITENIIEPLELADTKPFMPQELHGTRLAIGYSAMTREGKRTKMPFFQTNAIAPAAGFSSTAEDLAKFASWQMRLLEGGKNEILRSNTLKEMHRVHWLDVNWQTTRGLGFGVYRDKDVTFVGHEGSCPGYRSAVMLQPKKKIAVIFMANSLGISAGGYARGIYHIIQPAILAAQDTSGKEKSTDNKLLKYTGTYTYDPWGGEGVVIPWKGGLSMAFFPDDNPPTDLMKLKHIKDNLFHRVRDDGESGEEIEFILDENGNVVSIKRHSNYWKKIK